MPSAVPRPENAATGRGGVPRSYLRTLARCVRLGLLSSGEADRELVRILSKRTGIPADVLVAVGGGQ